MSEWIQGHLWGGGGLKTLNFKKILVKKTKRKDLPENKGIWIRMNKTWTLIYISESTTDVVLLRSVGDQEPSQRSSWTWSVEI